MIETKRLIIRLFNEDDAYDLFEYLSMDQTYIYEPGKPINIEASKKLVKERSQEKDFYAVVLKDDMKMIGHLYFKQIKPEEYLTWELGYIFNPHYHNRGYASEAAQALIQYAFRTFNTRRVIAHCNTLNIASWKMLEKIGMRREGHFIQSGYFRKDENDKPVWFDSYEYAILKDSE
jgi:ribosomal-protein-alanine N-acetyltransferase